MANRGSEEYQKLADELAIAIAVQSSVSGIPEETLKRLHKHKREALENQMTPAA